MARSGRNQDDYAPPKYVNLTLTGDALTACESWIRENETDVFNYVGALIGAGWKFSIKYDDSNRCCMVSATKWAPKEVNHNVCLTSRGNDPLDALLIATYKLAVLYANVDLLQVDRDSVRG